MNQALPLSIEGVSLAAGGRSLFRDLNLEVRPHQFISIMGENGIGRPACLKQL